MAYVPPSKNTPSALRKARFEAEQKAKHQAVLASVKKVSLTKDTPTTYVKG